MRMAFRGFKDKLPKNFKFIADGYSAYLLAAQQFFIKKGNAFKFDITQVIGLTNDDAVSAEFRPFKQLVERLNRTFKASYRVKCGFDNLDGASYDLTLWVAYYNFLRPHSSLGHRVSTGLKCLKGLIICPANGSCSFILGRKPLHIFKLSKLPLNLFLDFEPEA